MTFEDLKGKIIQMDEKKGWSDGQPGDLAKSIMLESAELLEHFQWDDTIRYRGQKVLSRNKNEIGKEMADILIYLIKMSTKMDIDLIHCNDQQNRRDTKKINSTPRHSVYLIAV